jgi:TolA-binding protein
VSLDFSEGSRIDVEPGARARVTDLGANGASLVVERGSLHVRVVHRESSDWWVVGGPFAVHVVGTEFDVAWDPQTEELTVSMQSGRVLVEGPCAGAGPRAVSAPETVHLTCAATAKQDASASPSASGAVAVADADATALVVDSAAPAASSAAPSDPADLASSGHELVELGSAARLAGDARGARHYYEVARRRFPGTDAAAIAAYHLGRMAFDGKHAWAEAERWFGVYLAESPGGALAPEALGRSMECAENRGDHARARELAKRYLAAYPSGAQASLAERLSADETP